MARIPIGLELYSVRNELAADVRGTLKAVAEMGYEGVEFAGAPQHPAEMLKELLEEFKLICCGWHTPFNMVQDDKIESTIAFNKTIRNPYVIIPGVSAKTKDDWLNHAKFFNKVADKLAPHGMFTGYHNHHTEYTPFDSGETPWDLFFGNTKKEVIMQLDLGNALYGGADLVGILKKYPGRPTTIHLKPYSKKAAKDNPHAGFRPIIGDDDVPWKEIFHLCETIGDTKWYIVEYESDAYPPLESVERCLKALKSMGK